MKIEDKKHINVIREIGVLYFLHFKFYWFFQKSPTDKNMSLLVRLLLQCNNQDENYGAQKGNKIKKRAERGSYVLITINRMIT